jgi:predicted DNA-binding transcriptional regulator YafY
MLPRIINVIKSDLDNKEIEHDDLKDHYQTSYGIFAGKPKHNATLKFYPPVTREVASIQWHPDQISEWQGDNYEITIPYNDDRELLRDILKYGNSVEVIKPVVLRRKVKHISLNVAALYSNDLSN